MSAWTPIRGPIPPLIFLIALAIEIAIALEDVRTKGPDDLLQPRTALRHNLARSLIGIQNVTTEFC